MGAQSVIEVAAKCPAPFLPGRFWWVATITRALSRLGRSLPSGKVFSLLQQTQQLDLRGDASRRSRPGTRFRRGFLHHAAPHLLGAGEGPPHVAEEVSAKTVSSRPATLTVTRCRGSPQAVGSPGDQLFADAALAGDQQRLGLLATAST